MRRSARVLQADRVSVPNSGEPAIQVITNLLEDDERAFYIRPDSPIPAIGTLITWGDDHTWYAGNAARKIGYNFDPDALLREGDDRR